LGFLSLTIKIFQRPLNSLDLGQNYLHVAKDNIAQAFGDILHKHVSKPLIIGYEYSQKLEVI
jgi:hypothetical protein